MIGGRPGISMTLNSGGAPSGGGGGGSITVSSDSRETGGGAGAIPLLVLIVMIEPRSAEPVGVVPMIDPAAAVLLIGVG